MSCHYMEQNLCIKKIWIYVLLLSVCVRSTNGDNKKDCVKINKKSGDIYSPFYNNQSALKKGYAANCTWELNPPDNEHEYYLLLRIDFLSLFYKEGEMENCTGSLTVDGTQIACGQVINDHTTRPDCRVFRHPSTCDEDGEPPDRSCVSNTTFKTTFFPVEVSYTSDGRSNFNGKRGNFHASYYFYECPEVTATESSETRSAESTGGIPKITPTETQKTPNQTTATSTHISKAEDWHTNSTKGNHSTDGNTGTSDSMIVGAVAGGIGLLVLILLIVGIFYMRKRKQSNASNSQPIAEEKANPIYQSQDPNYSFARNPNQSAPRVEPANYETVDLVSQAETTDETGKHKTMVDNILYETTG